MFDYEQNTRHHYKSAAVARAYHDSFSSPKGWSGLRFAFVARRERHVIATYLAKVPSRSVVDIPAGTGKLASVFCDAGSRVLACDVSDEMLDIAKVTYGRLGPARVAFRVVDLAAASKSIREEYDLTVCLRLLHRVPDHIRRQMLQEIAYLTPHAIVSFAIESPYQRLRRLARRAAFGGDDMGIEMRPDRENLHRMLKAYFEVLESTPIARGLSAECIYLLRSRTSRRVS